jgi:superfamily II DNA or RNA helicase
MHRLPQDDVRSFVKINEDNLLDQSTMIKLRKRVLKELREQLMIGIPTNAHETALKELARQIREEKIKIKLHLGERLHAKLYLLFREDEDQPRIGYLGSSNFTFSGLKRQGELNVDIVDHDATNKLANWFNERWNDRFCVDISDSIEEIIEDSWAGDELIPPYYIYLKMAYHLSQEARTGLDEFAIPTIFKNELFKYQEAAVKIAAHHLNKRGGVLIGDVVGLGKTIMATALASVFENDFGLETLIICPKNLVEMWKDYVHRYRLHADVLSISRTQQELPKMRRYRLIIIDESHNLRNREGKRYHAIRSYIDKNECKTILLTATPYNKTYLDLSNQLRLFIPEDIDIGIRPENKIRNMGGVFEFNKKHQVGITTMAAFEKSEYADDWRELMRLFLVRRTRSFIKTNYGINDPDNGRTYLNVSDGTRSYFPDRVPKTLVFDLDSNNSDNQFARYYAEDVVNTINSLNLPRYGLGNYVNHQPKITPLKNEKTKLDDLGRAGKRLMGFCRTNLFKRLESSGHSFSLSLERHILRNYVFLYALKNNLPLPLGSQGAELLDARINDQDEDLGDTMDWFDLWENQSSDEIHDPSSNIADIQDLDLAPSAYAFKVRAKEIYNQYRQKFSTRFQWIRSDLFLETLTEDLQEDAEQLINILFNCGRWDPKKDEKLVVLENLLKTTHSDEKVLVFSQFADTVRYLETQLKSRGIKKIMGVTGDTADPTAMAWRFSPISNAKSQKIKKQSELRILIATDVLSEGQNLQDCAIVVNYDLPWAIIRLIQRAGRVDRIGQQAEEIRCYSFLPAEGVEEIIKLRERVRTRLEENGEVVGSDEAFFEDDRNNQSLVDLYNEKSGILDGENDHDVDLGSYAYQIWNNATNANPEIKKKIQDMPDVVFSAKERETTPSNPEGVLVYMRTGIGTDALAMLDTNGNRISQSQYEVLKTAECTLDTAAVERLEIHHDLIESAVQLLKNDAPSLTGGQLGRASGARSRVYERLIHYATMVQGTLFDTFALSSVIDDIYRYPLKRTAKDTINRQLRADVSDEELCSMMTHLRDENMLCIIPDETEEQVDPKVICSMGLRNSIKRTD